MNDVGSAVAPRPMRPPPLVWRRYVRTLPKSSSKYSVVLCIPFLFLGPRWCGFGDVNYVHGINVSACPGIPSSLRGELFPIGLLPGTAQRGPPLVPARRRSLVLFRRSLVLYSRITPRQGFEVHLHRFFAVARVHLPALTFVTAAPAAEEGQSSFPSAATHLNSSGDGHGSISTWAAPTASTPTRACGDVASW
jgi:hypothetical protein